MLKKYLAVVVLLIVVLGVLIRFDEQFLGIVIQPRNGFVVLAHYFMVMGVGGGVVKIIRKIAAAK